LMAEKSNFEGDFQVGFFKGSVEKTEGGNGLNLFEEGGIGGFGDENDGESSFEELGTGLECVRLAGEFSFDEYEIGRKRVDSFDCLLTGKSGSVGTVTERGDSGLQFGA